ncbi:MAG: nucleoside-diphosphate sugar epimerase/dehydratase [bacterium]
MESLLKKVIAKVPFLRTAFFIGGDIILIALSFYLAFTLRFDAKIPLEYFPVMKTAILLTIAFCLPLFYSLRLYSFSWIYVSTVEMISLFKAISFGFLFLSVALYFSRDFPGFSGFPRSTIFISYFLVFIFCGAFRFAKRIYFQIFREGVEPKDRVLIVGAGDAGEQILRSILNAKIRPCVPIGFIDDNPQKRRETIHGLKVLGKIENIPRIIEENGVEEIIIALASAGASEIKNAVEKARSAGLKKIKIIPPISEMINGEVSIGNIREVQVEDLLGRDPVLLETRAIENFIAGKKVLITGAAGSIGSELSRQVAKFKPNLLLLLDQEETGIFNIFEELRHSQFNFEIIPMIADICNKQRVESIFSEFKPDIVFHAAAYKHVPLMEKHIEEAAKNNIFGTKIIAEAALASGVQKFVFISTDKAVNPTSVMGVTKRVGEKICQTLNQLDKTKFVSVRFGNVLASRGSVIPIFKEQIRKGGPVEVTHPEMRRYFMITSEAVLLVMQAGAIGKGGEVYVLDMGEPIKILDLAKEIIRFSGFEPDRDIAIVFTGSRPGEKLFEEMLTAEEGTVATEYKKIFAVKLAGIDKHDFEEKIGWLQTALDQEDREKMIGTLKRIVPSYARDRPSSEV